MITKLLVLELGVEPEMRKGVQPGCCRQELETGLFNQPKEIAAESRVKQHNPIQVYSKVRPICVKWVDVFRIAA